MKVRIVRQETRRDWHYAREKYAGSVVKVRDTIVVNGHIRCYVTEEEDLNIYIPVADAEVVDEPRLYEHEGKQYVLPDWVKFVSCDGTGKPLFGWACKPVNTGEGSYCYFITDEGRREKLKEYVKPLPAGAFVKEVE